MVKSVTPTHACSPVDTDMMAVQSAIIMLLILTVDFHVFIHVVNNMKMIHARLQSLYTIASYHVWLPVVHAQNLKKQVVMCLLIWNYKVYVIVT